MTTADVETIVALENRLFSDPWSPSAFEQQLTADGWGAIVAQDQNGIIGYACYFLVDVEAHLTNIAVVEVHRRKSVAKRLLDTILERARKGGCEYLILEVRPGNKAALAFYEKHGFVVLYHRPNYYRRPVEDALVMVRYLDNKEV